MTKKWRRFFPWVIKKGYLLHLIVRHPKTPWYLRLLMLFPAVYVLVPTDMLSDLLPILGQIDDLLVVGYGYLFLLKTIPKDVLEECRGKAGRRMDQIQWK